MIKQKREPLSSNPESMRDYITWILLLQTRDALLQAREKELSQYGISAEQAWVLFTVQAIGHSPTLTEISRWIFRKPNTVFSLLERMERKGLVKKTKNSVRKNLVRVELTEKGQQAYYQATKMKSIHKVMSCLSEEDRQQLNLYLSKLREKQLKKLGLECKPPFLESLAKRNN